MCRHLTFFGVSCHHLEKVIAYGMKSIERMRHGGPEPVGIYISRPHPKTGKMVVMMHKRLPRNGKESGTQPLYSEDRKIAVAVNAEVWNHDVMRKMVLKKSHYFYTKSDCEIFVHGPEEFDLKLNGASAIDEISRFFNQVDAMFALSLYDESKDRVILARDQIGKCPLAWGVIFSMGNVLVVSSEIKSLHDICDIFAPFPSCHFYLLENVCGRDDKSAKLADIPKVWASSTPKVPFAWDNAVLRIITSKFEDGHLHRWYNPLWLQRYLSPMAMPSSVVSLGDKHYYDGFDELTKKAIESKVMEGLCDDLKTWHDDIYQYKLLNPLEFPYADLADGDEEKHYPVPHCHPTWEEWVKLRTELRRIVICQTLRHKNMLDSDVKTIIFNSGGADSGTIVGICSWYDWLMFNKPTTTLTVGLENAPDLRAAHEVSAKWKTSQMDVIVDLEQLISAVPRTIYYTESCYPTLIRAGTPMKLGCEEAARRGFGVSLSGELSDELQLGYAAGRFCPSGKECEAECARQVLENDRKDTLRARMVPMASGIECRIPLASRPVVDFIMDHIPGTFKLCGLKALGRIEKWVWRKAFADFMPTSITFRPKIQFSNGVGDEWINGIKKYAEGKLPDLEKKLCVVASTTSSSSSASAGTCTSTSFKSHREEIDFTMSASVTEQEIKEAAVTFPLNTPHDHEAYLYRKLFHRYYPYAYSLLNVPDVGKTIACSSPEAVHWHKSLTQRDDSGHAVFGRVKDPFNTK